MKIKGQFMNLNRLFISTTIIANLFVAPLAHGSEVSDKVAQTLAKEFLKNQIKNEVESYLKSNPQILNPTELKAAAKAMKFIGAALAAYGLLTAETDKEKLFAAAGIGVAVSPDPYSGIILTAIQVTDMALSMEHAVKLAKIYEEISEIELRTAALYEQIYTEEFKRQSQVVAGISATLKEIVELKTKLDSDPVLKYLVNESSDYPTAEQAKAAFEDFGKMYQLLLAYRVQRIMFNGFVQTDRLEEFRLLERVLNEFETSNKPFMDSVDSLVKAVRKTFAATQASEDIKALNAKVAAYEFEVQKYVFCSNAVNRTLSAQVMGKDTSSSRELSDYRTLALECVEHFDWEILL